MQGFSYDYTQGMASYLYNTAVFCVYFALFPLCIFTRGSQKNPKPRILLTNDGPTTIGGKTTFSAVVLNCPGTNYRYCWEKRERKGCHIIKGRKDSYVIDHWNTTGKKKIQVIVEATAPKYQRCGQNTTSFLVTDSINARLTVSPHREGDSYFVGPVNISVQIHDPSHLFNPMDISYQWNFNDSTEPVINHLNTMTHNFTEDREYTVSVFMTSHALGRLYNGTVLKNLPFTVDFSPALQVHNYIPLRLAPPSKERIFVALGQLEFIVTYKDPYSIIENVMTGWSFPPEPPFSHPGNKISHNYTSVEETTVWATPRFVTPNIKKSIPVSLAIAVEEPVSKLNLQSNSSYTTKGNLQVNVTCDGSKPFMMCWKLIKTSHHPLFDNCSSLSQTCDFQINYTIPDSGSFTLDVVVMNYVGSANHIQKFNIAEPTMKPHSGTAAKTASAVLPVIICVIIVVIVLVFVARKVYSSRHHSVLETADFDFRDEDCRSIDSYQQADNKCFSSFRFCRGFSRKKESIPLLEDWGSGEGHTTMYSDIL